MNKAVLFATLAIASGAQFAAPATWAGGLGGANAHAAPSSLVTEVGRRHGPPRGVVVVRPAPRPHSHVYVRRWNHRPHYGSIVAGLTLGAIIAMTAANAAPPPPPRDDLCWYWANRSHTRGYWDYCD